MNEMSESLNIINQVIYKLIKLNKIKKKKDKSIIMSPHSILKYTYLKSWNQSNYKNNYISMEQLIKHFKY